MGMREVNPRWFRDPAQIEHRLWINHASTPDLEKRKDELELIHSLSVLSAQSLMELWRVADAVKQRWLEENSRRMRCPVCGGWALYGPSFLGLEYHNVIPRCRDCGWPSSTQIRGSNIIVSNPRTGFRLISFGGEF